jgi:hypothetical protein
VVEETMAESNFTGTKLVVIESPHCGATAEKTRENTRYAVQCMRDSMRRGESPFASHLLYPQVLVRSDCDADPEERRVGIQCGFDWGAKADLVAVYSDRGISEGMQAGIDRAHAAGQTVVHRSVHRR